jgi:CO/xanthine dehydrogenase Mo-binding subunit
LDQAHISWKWHYLTALGKIQYTGHPVIVVVVVTKVKAIQAAANRVVGSKRIAMFLPVSMNKASN